MIGKRPRRAGRFLVLVTASVLAALLLAMPTHAASVRQTCSVSVTSDGDSSQAAAQSGDGGSCLIQRRTGGDGSLSIRQVQTSNDDGDGRRTHRHRDRGDDGRTQDSSNEDFSASGSDELNCEDFSSQSDAQSELEEDSSDPRDLDADSDGRACEDSFGESVSSADTPRSGIETGGGGTLPPELARSNRGPHILALGPSLAGVLAVVLVVAGVSGLRRARRH